MIIPEYIGYPSIGHYSVAYFARKIPSNTVAS
jgi:hypothetical protein